MADELALRDRNRITALLVQNESGELVMAEATDATGRLKVDAIISGGSSSNTEYTEGDIESTISGIAIMWEDSADTLRTVSAAKPLPVNIQNTSITVASNITGIVDGVKTVTSAGTDESLVASSTPCKRVVIQAQTDNTGIIAVGTSGVDATISTGTGIVLYAGDAIELDIDDVVDIYIDATVSGEGVRFIYYT